MNIDVRRRDGSHLMFELPAGFDMRTVLTRMDDNRLVVACPGQSPLVLHIDTAEVEELRVQ